ncbi:hypothetical protein C2869_04995 [Saccharobesus litoralis]|uniref:HTH araC/xylS-type domain-containing protein n=1 Tax=Saccharobesus litoralis TaxID=2172099 RepID=A0A2S0VNQ6_9ALTE|nr:helix-turn-helix domain-containing protein [Saccharobesus litoralis]AWB65836.1 hypothetical protein C2869_04995 [Saccharobesus litoralis]
MGKIVIDWLVLFHNILPFAAAQLFLVVLIYFTLVKERIAQEYPYYATFLVSFIFYLTATLVNILPIQDIAVWFHYLASFSLFSLGFPSLVVALYMQSKVNVSPALRAFVYGIGSSWSIFYFITADYRTDKVNILASAGKEGVIADWVNFANLFYAQSLVIFCLLVIPGCYLLYRMAPQQSKTYVYGMLSLAVFAIIGSFTQFWSIYYIGSCFCALAWAWAMFKSIRDLNQQVKAHSEHEKVLASAQFAAKTGNVPLTDLYPDSIDESYPYREREDVLEALRTASTGLVGTRVASLVTSLKRFSGESPHVFKARIREILYLLVDTSIYLGCDAKTLIIRLEKQGQLIDACDNDAAIIELLTEECLYLLRVIEVPKRKTTVDALVERIKACVLANYYKEELTMDSIATEVGVSRSHALKSFKSKQGMTLNQYLIEVRVDKAKSFLLEKSVTETAYEVGFKNPSYFSTFFRKHTGLSPREYQQNAQIDI